MNKKRIRNDIAIKLDDYQIWINDVYVTKNMDLTISIDAIYPLLGLNGEVGELTDKIKKIYRNNRGIIDEVERQDIGFELGDILYYLARLSDSYGFSLSEIIKMNKAKITDRMKREVICGQGDKR